MIDKFDGIYEFLSNFYHSPIEENGITYPTVEHYFQAYKTLNIKERQAIANAPTPGKAKRMGRKVNLRSDWEEIKEDVMYAGLRLKFADPHLMRSLKMTAPEYLIEGNTWHDNTWGDCSCETCAQFPGKNKLGKLLMLIRDQEE